VSVKSNEKKYCKPKEEWGCNKLLSKHVPPIYQRIVINQNKFCVIFFVSILLLKNGLKSLNTVHQQQDSITYYY